MVDYKGVIFNLDNTVIDSLDVMAKTFKNFLKNKKLHIPTNYESLIADMSFLEIANYIKKSYGVEESCDDIVNELKKLVYDEYKKNVKLKNGILDYLIFLKENSIKTALITTCEKAFYEPCLKNNKVYDLFDIILDKDLTESENIYKSCIDYFKLNDNNIIMFETCIENIKIAKENNLRVFFLYDNLKSNPSIIADLEGYIEEYITDFRELIV